MGKIIAIGWGEIGRPREGGGFYPVETIQIDQEIIDQSGKKNPKLLFLPTASCDSEGYIKCAQKHFEGLWCQFDTLRLWGDSLDLATIRGRILSSDIVYVWGGNTLKMMNLWRKLGIDNILKEAYDKGIVLSGLSAGAICWFQFGNSDSRQFTSNTTQLIKVSGLGIIPALVCPHYNTEPSRQEDLPRMMKSTNRVVAIALDNCAALEVADHKYRLITSNPTAKGYRMYWHKGIFVKEEIQRQEQFENLENLLRKPW